MNAQGPNFNSAASMEALLAKHGTWMLILVAALALLPGIATVPISDVDEAKFAGASLEMMQRGDWIVPHFNGAPRYDKPPLIYWLQSLSFALLGVNELAARLPTVIAAALVALSIQSLGRRVASATSGFLSGFAWLTCGQLITHGRAAVADMPMVLAVVLTMRAILELLDGNQRQRYGKWFWVLYVSLGVGFLAKGPITLAVPALTLLLHRWVIWRKPISWRALQLWPGLLVTMGIMAAWGLPAIFLTQGAYWDVGIGQHVIHRGRETMFQHKTTHFFYLVAATASLSPWLAAAANGFRGVRIRWDSKTALMLAWLLAPYLLFTFYATRAPHYVLPGNPAFFLLIFLNPWPASEAGRFERLWFWLFCGGTIGALTLLGSIMLAKPLAPDFTVLTQMVMSFVVFALVHQLLAIAWRWSSWRGMFAALIAMSIAGSWLGCNFAMTMPAFGMRSALREIPPGTTCVGFQYSEPTLVYYSRSRWDFVQAPEELRKKLTAPGPLFIVSLRREVQFNSASVAAIRSGTPWDALHFSTDNSALLDQLRPSGTTARIVRGLCSERSSFAELEVWSIPSR